METLFSYLEIVAYIYLLLIAGFSLLAAGTIITYIIFPEYREAILDDVFGDWGGESKAHRWFR